MLGQLPIPKDALLSLTVGGIILIVVTFFITKMVIHLSGDKSSNQEQSSEEIRAMQRQYWDRRLDKIEEELPKQFSSILAATVIPILERQSEMIERQIVIQEKQREDSTALRDILIKISTRQENFETLARKAYAAAPATH